MPAKLEKVQPRVDAPSTGRPNTARKINGYFSSRLRRFVDREFPVQGTIIAAIWFSLECRVLMFIVLFVTVGFERRVDRELPPLSR